MSNSSRGEPPTYTTAIALLDGLLATAETCFMGTKVFCIGIGTGHGPLLTVEALAAIRMSNIAFGFPETRWIEQLTVGLGTRYFGLDYPPLARREEIFTKAAHRVAEAAIIDSPVAVLVNGSPVRHVWLTKIMRAWADRENFRVEVVHGISSLDRLIEQINVDDSEGVQLYDSSHLLLLRQRPDATAHCFVFNLENTLIQRSSVATVPRPALFSILKTYLLKFYPAEHQVTFAVSATNQLSDHRFDVELGDLERAAPLRLLGSLYIPPVRAAHVFDSQLESLSRLVTLSRSPLDRILSATAGAAVTLLRDRNTTP